MARRIVPLIAALATASALSVTATGGPALAEAATCRGQAATIIGTAGVDTVGTEGDDVVVNNGSTRVTALGGNDLICATGPFVSVDAGAGDDVVDTTAVAPGQANSFVVTLGEGNDSFFGGSGDDRVSAGIGGSDNIDIGRDTGFDRIDAGAGTDAVGSGEGNLANADVIQTGPGDDGARYAGRMTGTGSLDLGVGDNTLVYQGSWSGRLAIDARTQSATLEGAPQFTWTGAVVAFGVEPASQVTGQLVFRGTRGDDLIYSRNTQDLALEWRTGGGDDTMRPYGALSGTDVFDGGSGRDSVELNTVDDAGSWVRNSVRVDLATDRFDVGVRIGARPEAKLPRVEDVTVGAKKVKVTGDRHDNAVSVAACRARLALGRGDDQARWMSSEDNPDQSCGTVDTAFSGGEGDDRLSGAYPDDVLIGGRGFDRVNGGSGRDLCLAERARNCERRG